MINVTIDGIEYKIPNNANEVKLGSFNVIYDLMQRKDIGKFEMHCKVFEHFGIPEKVLDELLEDEIFAMIKEFNAVLIPPTELVGKVEINGRSYTAFEDEFKFKARDIVEIERASIKQVDNYPAHLLAILFKDDELTPNEHYTPAHLKHKSKLFSEHLTTDIAIPYLAKVAERTLNKIVKKLEAEPITEPVASELE